LGGLAMEIAVLKRNAKVQLSGKWGLAIITLLASLIIISGFSVVMELLQPEGGLLTIFGDCVSTFLGGVITLGMSKFVLNIAVNEEANFNDLFSGFNIYFKTLGLWILMSLSIGIATLFFIIPGILVALMFSQAFFILCEDNEKSIIECFKESLEIMNGHKLKLFVLELSFAGWWIIAIITLGIGILWVYPYQQVTLANFYLAVKDKTM
jgi:uncharacterized membrane protein